MYRRYLALALIVVYVLLGTYFSLAIPAWEATDEITHFHYAEFLLANHRLPLQSLDPAKHETSMAHYPPLYYALLAALIAPFDRSDLAQTAAPNLAYVWANPSSGGYDAVLHDRAAEQFPYRGVIRALHVGRLLSVLAGAIVVLAAYQIGKLMFGRESPITLGAMMMTAFLPSFLFTSATVHVDSLVSALGALALWQLLAFVREPTTGRLLGVAVLLGLATLAKSTAIVLLAMLPLALILVWLRERDTAKAMRWLGLGVTVFLAVAGWWLLRNQFLYGDPLGYSVYSRNPIFPINPRPVSLSTISEEIVGEWSPQSLFWHTLILAFGYMDGYGPRPLYTIAYGIAAIAVIGLAIAVVRWRSLWRIWLPEAVLGAAAVGLIYAAVIQHALTDTGGAHGRYIFPVLPLLSLGFVLGIRGLIPSRIDHRVLFLPGACLLVLSILTPILFIAPTYALGNQPSNQEISSLVGNREASFGGLIRLIRAEVSPERVEPGGQVMVKLYWQALADVRLSYRVIVELLSVDYKLAARADRSPGYGKAATNLWQKGDVISDTFTLQIPEDIPIGLYRVGSGFYKLPELVRLPVQGPNAGEGDLATLGQVKILGKPPVTSGLPRAVFGDQIALIQGEVLPWERQSGQPVIVHLTWLAKAKPDADYTISVQLLSPAGAVVAQQDSPPGEGRLPTSSWEAGDVISDTVRIQSPDQAAGDLDAYLILYSRATGKRLQLGGVDAFYLGKLKAN